MSILVYILVGRIITEILHIHDFCQLYLSDGTIVNAYGPIDLDGAQGDELRLAEGEIILSISETENRLILHIAHNRRLSISIDPEEQNGPEFVSITTADKRCVVIN